MIGLSWDADVWLRFWSWCLVEILKMKFDQGMCLNLWYVLNLSYFGKLNSTLGSVVPFAMFLPFLQSPQRSQVWNNYLFQGLHEKLPIQHGLGGTWSRKLAWCQLPATRIPVFSNQSTDFTKRSHISVTNIRWSCILHCLPTNKRISCQRIAKMIFIDNSFDLIIVIH